MLSEMFVEAVWLSSYYTLLIGKDRQGRVAGFMVHGGTLRSYHFRAVERVTTTHVDL